MDNLSSHTQIIEKINAFLDKYHSDLSYCHGADHVRRVAKLAVKIGKIEKADCQIIEIAALLHDIGVIPLGWSKHMLGKDENDLQEFLGLYVLTSTDHGEIGALIAERFLGYLGYSNPKRQHVKQIISEHSKWKEQTTLESRIVNDADRLELLGATWIARAFQRTSAFDRRLGIESVPERFLGGKEKLLPDDFHTGIAKKMGIPIVTIMHGYKTMMFSSVLNQVINFRTGYSHLLKSFLSLLYYSAFQEFPLLVKSSIIIAVSERVANALGRRPLIDKNKVIVINNGIDIETFKPSEDQSKQIRDKLNILDQDRAILFLSLISKQKGTDIAIKAFNELSHLKNIKLIIAGDGEYLNDAKLLARYYGIESKVVFTGFIPNEDTPKYYNASDIFIFPTLRLESFGIVLAEAMACRKPVIASNIGSIPDVIDDGVNGILVPHGDFRELARQIDMLLNDQSYFETLGGNAYSKARERFDINRMVGETIKAFELAIENTQQI